MLRVNTVSYDLLLHFILFVHSLKVRPDLKDIGGVTLTGEIGKRLIP